VARSPHRDGFSASLAWAAAVIVGLLLTLIATAAMANEQSTGQIYPAGFVTNAWAGDNQLMSVATQFIGPGNGATSFTYDGLGRRTSITETPTGGTATTTNYVWCGDQLCQAQTSAGTVARAYYAEGEYVPGSPATSLITVTVH